LITPTIFIHCKPSSTDLLLCTARGNKLSDFLFQFQVILVVLGGVVMGYRVVPRVQGIRLMLPLLLLVILLVAVSAESTDYYDLLGISREATTREIRRAFKKLALTMHPDKNPVSHYLKQKPEMLTEPPIYPKYAFLTKLMQMNSVLGRLFSSREVPESQPSLRSPER